MIWAAILAWMAVLVLGWILRSTLQQLRDARAAFSNCQDALATVKRASAESSIKWHRREMELLDEINGLHAQISTHHCGPNVFTEGLSASAGELRRLRELLAIVAARQDDGILRISRAELAQIERGATVSTRDDIDGDFVIQVLVPAALPRIPGMVKG